MKVEDVFSAPAVKINYDLYIGENLTANVTTALVWA